MTRVCSGEIHRDHRIVIKEGIPETRARAVYRRSSGDRTAPSPVGSITSDPVGSRSGEPEEDEVFGKRFLAVRELRVGAAE
jgi:hypothetical protein